jgi:L-Ala-D/L-Glu epimerase
MRLDTDPASFAAALGTFAGTARITVLEAIPFAVPYRRAPKFASGSVSSADNVLVRVHTDAGLVGQAEAQPRPYTYGETQSSIVDAVGRQLNEALMGVDPLRVELVAERCAGVAGNRVARGAVDLAVWDLIGQILGCPCHTLLGGFADDVAAAHMVSFGDPTAMADEAVAVNERLGVKTFKVKVGRTPALDLAAIRAVREALPDADLYVDANRGWSYDDAVRAGDQLAELGVRAIEEPISIDDRVGRLRLAGRWAMPMVGDESCISLAHVDRELEEGAVRAVSVKTARTGFTESRRILDLCLARNVPIVVGSQYEGAIGAMATIAFAAAFAATAGQPAEITNFIDLADDLVVAAPEICDGRAPVPTTPGLGFEVDEDRLARYRLDR